jgi:hypothetical protein
MRNFLCLTIILCSISSVAEAQESFGRFSPGGPALLKRETYPIKFHAYSQTYSYWHSGRKLLLQPSGPESGVLYSLEVQKKEINGSDKLGYKISRYIYKITDSKGHRDCKMLTLSGFGHKPKKLVLGLVPQSTKEKQRFVLDEIESTGETTAMGFIEGVWDYRLVRQDDKLLEPEAALALAIADEFKAGWYEIK